MATTPATRLLTADEFDELPDPGDGSKLELDEGVVVVARPAPESEEMMVTFDHGEIQAAIGSALRSFARQHRLGRVVVEAHFRFQAGADGEEVVRGPDVAFVRRERLPEAARLRQGSAPVVPDLAVEVVSPSDRAADVERKVRQYLAAGAVRVWVVYPSDRTVTVFRPSGDGHRYNKGDTLFSDEAGFDVDGFVLPLSEVFS
jgi:Uma2 family endonuclease